MDGEVALRVSEEVPSADAADDFNLDGVFEAFKVGVETPIDAEDTETHYNLGIAYKEMGLLDDAVAEFDKAMRNPGRWVDSLTLKGTCLFEKGAFDQAEEVFKSGLAYPGLNTAERTSLHYEMGLLYEAWQRPLEALGSFQRAADADLFFRDVGEKVEALRKTLGLEAKDGKDDSGAKGNKSRVSYV
jgi:tetratricopeptide (TPR) repeat protein